MDAFELLKKDHEKVSGIFKQIESEAAANNRREELFRQLNQELDVHAHIEETILYPMLKQASETHDITVEAIEEHQKVKELLAELKTMPAGGDKWGEKLTELKDAVEHHVEEEEGEMFDKAREVLSREKIEELGGLLAAEKQRQQRAAGAQ